MSTDDQPASTPDPDGLADEIRADARAERRVLWVALVGLLVTAAVLVVLGALR